MLTSETSRGKWRDEDTDKLAYNWERLGSVFLISCVMGRPKGAIQTKASHLGLPRRDPPQGHHRRKWTAEELARFWKVVDESKDGFGRIDILLVAERTERPVDVVASRIQERFADEDALRRAVVIPKDVYNRMATLRAKQGINPVSSKARMRNCLSCEKTFFSDGPGNRLCSPCKSSW